MFKVVKMNVCPSLQSDLDLQIREHSYSTRGSGTYVVPFPRVEFALKLIISTNLFVRGITCLKN